MHRQNYNCSNKVIATRLNCGPSLIICVYHQSEATENQTGPLLLYRGRDGCLERHPNLVCAELKGWEWCNGETMPAEERRRAFRVWYVIVCFCWPIWKSDLAAPVNRSGGALVCKCIHCLFELWKTFYIKHTNKSFARLSASKIRTSTVQSPAFI